MLKESIELYSVVTAKRHSLVDLLNKSVAWHAILVSCMGGLQPLTVLPCMEPGAMRQPLIPKTKKHLNGEKWPKQESNMIGGLALDQNNH
eukprot:3213285-Amphidinium_carterae.2